MRQVSLAWECVGPGNWKADPYTARRTNPDSNNSWELRRNGHSLYKLRTLEECKSAAQAYEDRLTPINIENYPLAGVTRVEVIDHRPTAQLKGRALVAHDVQRAVLSFQDDNRTLKVMLK